MVLVLALDRGVVGRDMTLILDSFGATTWSLLLLLAVTLAVTGASWSLNIIGSISCPPVSRAIWLAGTPRLGTNS